MFARALRPSRTFLAVTGKAFCSAAAASFAHDAVPQEVQKAAAVATGVSLLVLPDPVVCATTAALLAHNLVGVGYIHYKSESDDEIPPCPFMSAVRK